MPRERRMIKEILEEAKNDLKKVEEDFRKELAKFRTGRASVAILDGIQIDYYGTPTPINQLATLGVPEANLIIIQPWDHKFIAEVEKAIRNSNIGINPVSDGRVIKLPVPPLDQQRRMEIIKTMKKYTEERKTHIRTIRRDYRDMAKSMKDGKEITEDEEKRYYEDLQKVIDEKTAKLEELEKAKEKHILED
jgi:ribosome recycling factor